MTKAKFAAIGNGDQHDDVQPHGAGRLHARQHVRGAGVQPGDVIAFSFSTDGPRPASLSAAPAEGTAGTNTISLEICENAGVLAAVTPGSLIVHWIAIR